MFGDGARQILRQMGRGKKGVEGARGSPVGPLRGSGLDFPIRGQSHYGVKQGDPLDLSISLCTSMLPIISISQGLNRLSPDYL